MTDLLVEANSSESSLTKFICPHCDNIWYEPGESVSITNRICADCTHIFMKDYTRKDSSDIPGFTINYNNGESVRGSFLRSNKRRFIIAPVISSSNLIIDYVKEAQTIVDNVRVCKIPDDYQDYLERGIFEQVPEFPVCFDSFPDLKETLRKLKRDVFDIGIKNSLFPRDLFNHRIENIDGTKFRYDIWIVIITCELTGKCRSVLKTPIPTSGFSERLGIAFHGIADKRLNSGEAYRITITESEYSIRRYNGGLSSLGRSFNTKSF